MSEQNNVTEATEVTTDVTTTDKVKGTRKARTPKAEAKQEQTGDLSRLKIHDPLVPFSEVFMGLPKSIKPKAFDGGGGQIQIVTGALRLGTTQCWMSFGVVLRWAGSNTAKLAPAVQLPKMASNRFEAAIKSDDVASKSALDNFERELAAAAVAFYNEERKKSERQTGTAVVQSSAVQTFDAASLGFDLSGQVPTDAPKGKK